MNTVQIQPVTIVNQTANQLYAYVIHYDLNAQNCNLFWSLNNSDGVSLYSSNWSVPADVLAQWGSDDSVIINALAAANGFVIAPQENTP
jgi:hypothetical protein